MKVLSIMFNDEYTIGRNGLHTVVRSAYGQRIIHINLYKSLINNDFYTNVRTDIIVNYLTGTYFIQQNITDQHY